MGATRSNLYKLCVASNWTCHLCKGIVPRFTSFNAPDGPSRDHVVPRSQQRGLTNNILLAHRYCNTIRSDLTLGKCEISLFEGLQDSIRKFYGDWNVARELVDIDVIRELIDIHTKVC